MVYGSFEAHPFFAHHMSNNVGHRLMSLHVECRLGRIQYQVIQTSKRPRDLQIALKLTLSSHITCPTMEATA